MLKNFIRLTPNNYILEDQVNCISESEDNCNVDIESPILIKANDIIKWIVNKSELTYLGSEIADLRIGLTNCGVLIQADIGALTEGPSQVYCQANIPSSLSKDCYELVIYSIYNPADCSQFQGLTLQETIDTGTILANVLQCTLNNFI